MLSEDGKASKQVNRLWHHEEEYDWQATVGVMRERVDDRRRRLDGAGDLALFARNIYLFFLHPRTSFVVFCRVQIAMDIAAVL